VKITSLILILVCQTIQPGLGLCGDGILDIGETCEAFAPGSRGDSFFDSCCQGSCHIQQSSDSYCGPLSLCYELGIRAFSRECCSQVLNGYTCVGSPENNFQVNHVVGLGCSCFVDPGTNPVVSFLAIPSCETLVLTPINWILLSRNL
jgi:hypothetical protein